MRQILLDTETTGLDPAKGHRIIEIGCIEMINRELTGKNFHCYLNPEREVERAAFEVHGLGDDFLADKPLFADVVTDFLAFVEGAEIIIHNAPFDVGFINAELKRLHKGLGKLEKRCRIFDTLTLAREKHPGQKNNLDALCKRYGVDHFSRDLHGALLDSEILAQVYLAMTGGQESLFGETGGQGKASQKGANAKTASATAVDRPMVDNIKVVKASDAELAAHQAFLEILQPEGK
jgi:DNA polymerase III subunit epsilon